MLQPLPVRRRPRFHTCYSVLCAGAISLMTVSASALAAMTTVMAANADIAQALSKSTNQSGKVGTSSVKPPTGPAWQDLTASQQAALKPLSSHWARLETANRLKWIALSKNFEKLAPEAQSRLQSRMTEWASLSRQDRARARLNYAEVTKLSPTQQVMSWQAYQALSPADKAKLASQATAKPIGVAPIVKPIGTKKLAAVPVTRQGAKLAVAHTDGGAGHQRKAGLPEEPKAIDKH